MLRFKSLNFPSELKSYEKSVNYFIKKRWNEESNIKVPKYLHEFIEMHLYSWIQSAFRALIMEEGNDYIVDVDRHSSRADRNPKIIIIDKDTGVDQFNSQWNEALHQFLQLKHQCKISLINLKAVFISNIKYFNKYERIYGLTGTLGSSVERKFLQETYQVDFINIPLAMGKQFKESAPIICKTINVWEKEIYESSILISKTRSVLIICETVNDVDRLYRYFESKDKSLKVFRYRRSYEQFDIISDGISLQKGVIIIATNLAGRGTDIKISEELNESGGLHVILSYLPNNMRVEQQAFGRAARKGNMGSGQLIFLYDSNGEKMNTNVFKLKNERDDDELYRISEIKSYYNSFIKFEEEFFDIFSKSYESLKSRLNSFKIKDEMEEIILSSILDKWAFWLDRIGEKLQDNNNYDNL